MKRIVSALAAMVMILALMPVATAEGDVILRLEGNPEPVQVGETVTVTAYAENAPDCTGFSVTVLYDAAVLKPISVNKGEAAGEFVGNQSYSYSGQPAVLAMGYDLSFCFSGDLKLATFTFEVIGETAGLYGTPLKIALSYFTRDAEDPGDAALGQKRKHGRIYVGEDEVLSTAQAVEILRHLIGFPSEKAEHLDWNGNGSLGVDDAVLLLRELN